MYSIDYKDDRKIHADAIATIDKATIMMMMRLYVFCSIHQTLSPIVKIDLEKCFTLHFTSIYL